MKDFIVNIIEKFGTKLVSSWVTKGVTALASILIAHHFMKAEVKDNWIASNVDVITGIIMGLLSLWLTKKKVKKHENEKQVALYSAPPGYKLVPEETQTGQNFTSGGVRAGATEIK
jgi:hypothetical protein